ncbi:alcohol dehydrogenase catalytic domain-containing protein [Psychromicrobium sp. YIM B11713]|uniref:alcohol dehydrogenase catalytic domain-containing protein n=1 Tax=Psychromicrobium sp. YIM B11713 TaxID=3145233 RepID=UPI00374EDB68
MKAIVNQASALVRVIELEPPVAGPGEVLLKVHAASINPVDVHVRGYLQAMGLDQVQDVGLGWDVAGEVVQLGEGVETGLGSLVAGVQSAGMAKPYGTLAEYAVLPAVALAELPQTISAVQAASLPMNSLTAAQGLDLLGAAEGRKLLVTGAAGAVGGFALSLARRAGFEVSGLARPSDAEFIRSAEAEFITEIPVGGFDAVFDAAALGAKALGALHDGGAYSGVIPGNSPESERGISIRVVQMTGNDPRLTEFFQLAVDGELDLRIAGTFGFGEAAEVADRLLRGGQRGRWVLLP